MSVETKPLTVVDIAKWKPEEIFRKNQNARIRELVSNNLESPLLDTCENREFVAKKYMQGLLPQLEDTTMKIHRLQLDRAGIRLEDFKIKELIRPINQLFESITLKKLVKDFSLSELLKLEEFCNSQIGKKSQEFLKTLPQLLQDPEVIEAQEEIASKMRDLIVG